MLLKIGNRLINTAQMVGAKYVPAHAWEDDEQGPPRTVVTPAHLELTMTSVSGQEVTNYDGDVIAAYSESDLITLSGQEADDVWALLSFQGTDAAGFAKDWKKASEAE